MAVHGWTTNTIEHRDILSLPLSGKMAHVSDIEWCVATGHFPPDEIKIERGSFKSFLKLSIKAQQCMVWYKKPWNTIDDEQIL